MVKEVGAVFGSITCNDFLCQMYGLSESVKFIEVESVVLFFFADSEKMTYF